MTENNEKLQSLRDKLEARTMHYHGDTLRHIYIVMAVIMLVSTPFCSAQATTSSTYSVIIILILSLFAGLTTPKSRFIIVIDFMISLAVLFVFSSQFITSNYNDYASVYFVSNLALALLSIAAVYFSSKTLRGNLLS